MRKCIMVLVAVMILTTGCMSMLDSHGAVTEYEGIKIGIDYDRSLENPYKAYIHRVYKYPSMPDWMKGLSREMTVYYIDHEPGDQNDYYELMFTLSDVDWHFIDGYVAIKVDGRLFTFCDDDPYRSVIAYNDIMEIATSGATKLF